ncbi:hypothetical protein M752DRAFT_82034 [Aspergillus phoenicis ATCC 13157]|uniref:Uncharacterized protein n=1 Tax=Aspergillus phoenicis ATCC 13157 TaxID=1353007 RepID=A0A370P7L3_ASPPH|nr:hypothetical protein M752DRAFT_82034 [Aspergillus phoenicis ATCC 13157]
MDRIFQPVATGNKVIVTAFNVGSLSRAVSRMPDLEWLRGHAESEWIPQKLLHAKVLRTFLCG